MPSLYRPYTDGLIYMKNRADRTTRWARSARPIIYFCISLLTFTFCVACIILLHQTQSRFFGRPDRAIIRTGYRITLTRRKLLPRRSCVQSLFVCKPMSEVAVTNPSDWRPAHCAATSKPPEVANFSVNHIQHYRTVGRWSL